jgi:Fe-S-cluster containining protein
MRSALCLVLPHPRLGDSAGNPLPRAKSAHRRDGWHSGIARRRREGWDKPLLESLAPCAVLADGLCTAHPSRPIVCRTTMSLDADQCRLACSLPDEAVIPSALASVAPRSL